MRETPQAWADRHAEEMVGERSLRIKLRHLFGETRGGLSRTEIIRQLRTRPANPNQLAKSLGVDYKTIQHHLRVLEENYLTAPSGKTVYGKTYLLTPRMTAALPILDEIWNRISMDKAAERAKLGIAGNCRVEDRATSKRVVTFGKVPDPDRVGLQLSKKPVNNTRRKGAC